MKDFMEKDKRFFKKLDGEKIKSFCIDKKNYIAVAVLCLVFIVVLACLTGNNGKTKSEEVTESSTDTQAQAQDTEISSDIVNNFVFDPEFEKDKNVDDIVLSPIRARPFAIELAPSSLTPQAIFFLFLFFLEK